MNSLLLKGRDKNEGFFQRCKKYFFRNFELFDFGGMLFVIFIASESGRARHERLSGIPDMGGLCLFLLRHQR